MLQPIGRGAMGVVYAAYDPDLDRRIALKVLRRESWGGDERETRLRLFREARALARLSHPNVLPVHDVGIFGTDVFIATELVEGQTLRTWVRKRRSWHEVLDVMIPAGRALAAAHAVGIVHRDFKPSNVMLGNDGRVRVMDFGLARRSTDGDDGLFRSDAAGSLDVSATRSVLDSELTEAGAVMGTPAYSSPEQLEGDDVDPRSDQFSFCVVMYEFLAGKRPFGGRTFKEVARAIREGSLDGSWGRGIPVRLRKAVVRGLDPQADERWPDMTALLDALESARHRPSRTLVAVLGGMAIFGGVAYAQFLGGGGRDLCSGAQEQVTTVWGESQRAQLRRNLRGSRVSHASETIERVERGLDEYAQAWATAHRDACAATRLRHEQSETLMDQRLACLERAKWELESLVNVLTTADGSVVGTATQAVASLSPLTSCDAHRVLEAHLDRVQDPALRIEIDRWTRELSRAKAFEDAGMTEDGLRVANEVVFRAKDLGYRPLIAQAMYRQGSLESRAGRSKESYESLFEAAEIADSARMDALAANAKALLVFVTAYRLADLNKADDWARHAAAAVHRAGDEPRLAALLEYYLSALAMRKQDLVGADVHSRRALELWEQVDPPPALLISNAHNAIGLAALEAGRYSDARADFQQAVDTAKALLGPMHPNVTLKFMNLGNVEAFLGHPDRARDIYHEGLVVFEANGMGKSQEYAGVLTRWAKMLTLSGQWEEARKAHDRAVDLQQEIDGDAHPATAAAIYNSGEWFFLRGELDLAGQQWRRALDIHEGSAHRLGLGHTLVSLAELDLLTGDLTQAHERANAALEHLQGTLGGEHPELAAPLVTLGKIALERSHPQEALERCQRAVTLVIGELGPRHELMGAGYGCIGKAVLSAGDAAAALEPLEKGLSAAMAQKVLPPGTLASLRFSLGHALLETGSDRIRGKALVEEAMVEWSAAGDWARGKMPAANIVASPADSSEP